LTCLLNRAKFEKGLVMVIILPYITYPYCNETSYPQQMKIAGSARIAIVRFKQKALRELVQKSKKNNCSYFSF